MPKKLTVFEAPDGRQFPTRDACKSYEAGQWRTDQLITLLAKNPYVAHHAADLSRAIKDEWVTIRGIMEGPCFDG